MRALEGGRLQYDQHKKKLTSPLHSRLSELINQLFNLTPWNFDFSIYTSDCMVDDRLEIKIKVLNFEETMINPLVQSTEAEDFDLKSDFEFL